MKKFVSLLLVLCMVLSLSTVAFAAEKTCTCGHAPVIYVPGMGETIYDYSEETPLRIYAPEESLVKEAMPSLVVAVLALLTRQYRLFANYAMRGATIMLGRAMCDEQGVPLYPTGIMKRPLPTSGEHGKYKAGVGDYAYYYDWRLDPMDMAKGLREFVDRVKQITGHDTVAFVCHSMGNTVMASYLYMYGSDDVEKIACLSPAYQGLSIMGSLLAGEADLKGKSKQAKLLVDCMLGDSEKEVKIRKVSDVAYKLGLYGSVIRLLNGALRWEFNRVYDKCLRQMFAHMRGVWAFVPDEYYERAKEFSFGNDPKYAKMIELIDDYHYNVQTRVTDILQDAMDKGVEVIIVSGYGISSLPLSYAHTTQADFVIDTKYMSIGATCADFGTDLGKDYKQANADGHSHVSPELYVDASTGAFPEYTWYVRDQMHFDSPTRCTALVRWFMSLNTQPDVHTNPAFPQFLSADLKPLAD